MSLREWQSQKVLEIASFKQKKFHLILAEKSFTEADTQCRGIMMDTENISETSEQTYCLYLQIQVQPG